MAKCVGCGLRFGAAGSVQITVAQVEQHIINMPAVMKQTGLAMAIGSAPIARVMGPDEDMTWPVGGTRRFVVCMRCQEVPFGEIVHRAMREMPNEEEVKG